jgi:hypothetical protein
LLVNLGVAVVAVVLTVGAAEAVFRIFIPREYASPLVHVWDRQLALRQLPGARGRIVTPEFTTEVRINSKGLRDAERAYAKPPGRRRILCLGDSFTFGYGVDQSQAFAAKLENLLIADEAGSVGWEVINAGVPGTGTAHQLAYFQFEGYRYQPDYVLLVFCGTNDFRDNIMCGLYSFEDGRLVKHDAQLSRTGKVRRVVESLPGYRSIFRNSRLLMFVGHRLTLWAHRRSSIPPQETDKIAARNAAAYDLTERLILGLREASAARGATLVAAVAPEIDAGEERGEVPRLVDFIRAEDIRYVDLAAPLNEAAGRGEQCFYPVDHHWTVRGHGLVAQALKAYFLGAEPSARP